MKVKPYESCRFWVTSENIPGKRYLVDLSELQCSCEHFQIRLRKLREKGEKVICKHIRAVIFFLGYKVAKEMAAKHHQPQRT